MCNFSLTTFWFHIFFRLDSNLDVANRVDANVVTKTETMTIGELFSYIKQEAAKVIYFPRFTNAL